jgi:hypothetical protein
MYLSHGLDNKRKISIPALIITLLFTALAGSLLVNLAAANPVWWYFHNTPPPTVEVIALNTDTLTLTFSVRTGIPPGTTDGIYPYFISSINVRVDGQLWSRHAWSASPISVSLGGLSNGWHTVEVTATASVMSDGSYDSSPQASSGVIEFQVDAPPPSISVISQKTFEASSSTADVPLNFTVNKPFSWVGYSLDGNNVVTATHQVASTERFGTVNCQLVLNHVPADTHSLTVYAEDTVGNRGESKPFTFTVTQQTLSDTGQTETSPTTTTATASAIIASATAIAFGLLANFLKHKRKSNTT